MRVRPFASGDSEAIQAILDATYGDDPWVRSLHDRSHGLRVERPHFQRLSLVAEIDGAVVAAGTLSHVQRHPRRSWISIDVAPAHRRRGVGTALLNELRGLTERPLCARARLAEEAAIAFLRRHGFGLLDPSWNGRFDPVAVAERLPEPALGEPPTPDEAAAFFERWYAETHPFDPPTPWPLERIRAIFCGDDLVDGSLVGVRDGGSLIAAACLSRGPGHDSGDELYLVWAFGADGDTASAVVGACVRFALAAGKAIRFEVNEPNAPLREALARLGVLGEPDLGIFAEDATSDRPRSGRGRDS